MQVIISQLNTLTNQTTILKLYKHINGKCTDFCKMLEREFKFYQKCKDLDLVSQAHEFHKDYHYKNQDIEIIGCAMEMEYAPEKDFGQLVYSNDVKVNQSLQTVEMFKSYSLQMAKAVQQLHDNNIVHNNIKDDSFFMYDYDLTKQTVNLKIADFGFAGEMVNGENRSFQEIYDSVKDKNDTTLSPEQRDIKDKKTEKPIDEKASDIYCLGLSLLQVFTRIPVDKIINDKNLQNIIDEQDVKNFISTFHQNSDILQKLNADDTDGYPKISEILKIVFKTLHSDPSKRSNLQNFIEEIDKIQSAQMNIFFLNKTQNQNQKTFKD